MVLICSMMALMPDRIGRSRSVGRGTSSPLVAKSCASTAVLPIPYLDRGPIQASQPPRASPGQLGLPTRRCPRGGFSSFVKPSVRTDAAPIRRRRRPMFACTSSTRTRAVCTSSHSDPRSQLAGVERGSEVAVPLACPYTTHAASFLLMIGLMLTALLGA